LGGEGGDVEAQMVGGLGASDVQASKGCEKGEWGGRVDEGASAVPEVGPQGGGAGDEGAVEAEGLAEGANEDVWSDVVAGAEAGSAGAEKAESVSLINDENGAVKGSEAAKLAKIGGVAVHAEVALGDDPMAIRRAAEGLADTLEVEVGDDVDGGFAETAAVDDGGVVEGVGDDEVFGLGEGAKDSEVGGVATGEEEG
jgi:hypothetical protein